MVYRSFEFIDKVRFLFFRDHLQSFKVYQFINENLIDFPSKLRLFLEIHIIIFRGIAIDHSSPFAVIFAVLDILKDDFIHFDDG